MVRELLKLLCIYTEQLIVIHIVIFIFSLCCLFSQLMMNFVVLNHHIGGLSFGTSVQRVVRALGFTSFREFLQKDSHHIIPYLVPAMVKNPGTSQLLNDIGRTMMIDPKTLIEETFQVSSEVITNGLNAMYFLKLSVVSVSFHEYSGLLRCDVILSRSWL